MKISNYSLKYSVISWDYNDIIIVYYVPASSMLLCLLQIYLIIFA